MFKNAFFLNKVHRISIFFLLFCITIEINSFSQSTYKTDWFKNSKYGLLVHYLNSLQNSRQPWDQGKITTWDSCVNSFDVNKFASDVAETGAGYVIFTTQQNDQFFSVPNNTFEKLSGYKRGTATPKRDLVNDIYAALNKKGIKLMLYVTGNGPFTDPRAMAALTGNKPVNALINRNFLNSWSLVLKDISLRYKGKIKGWWVDGAYPFIGYNDTSLTILAKALKAGNQNAIVAFNQAPRDSVSFYTALDDFTAGEMYSIKSFPRKRFVGKAQWHAVTFLGKEWAQPGARFTASEIKNYINGCNKEGGVVTLDVCLFRNGSLDVEQKNLFKQIKKNIK